MENSKCWFEFLSQDIMKIIHKIFIENEKKKNLIEKNVSIDVV